MSKSFEESEARPSAFGERLRREREARGISLDEISAATKIGTRLLRALEDEQFELLPGGIFNKGYVRAYARHLGIDEEQAIADYLRASQEPPPDLRLIAHQSSAARSEPGFYLAGATRQSGFPWIPVLILLLVIGGASGGWQLYRQRQRERQAATKPRAGPVAQFVSSDAGSKSLSTAAENAGASPATANVTGSASSAVHTVEAAESTSNTAGPDAASATTGAAGSRNGAPFEVMVRAKGRARVEIKSDGDVVVQGVIEPSDVKTFHATNRLVFWTANAGEVELSFNGKDVPLNRGENEEQVLVFNSHGLIPRPAAQ